MINEKKRKNSEDFWHKKSTFKVRFWYFSKNAMIHRQDIFFSFEHVDSCFLGPTIFEILQPNWYYYTTWTNKQGNVPTYFYHLERQISKIDGNRKYKIV